MPSLSQCVVTGSVYDVNGDLVGAGFRINIVKTVKSGQVVQWLSEPAYTLANGTVTLTLPRSSTAYIYANAIGLRENGNAGVALTIPNAATANLEDLVSVTSIPAEGLTVKDEGTALTDLVGTFNFVGSGVTVTQPSAGVATVTITAGSGVTLREVDGSPSLTASTVEFLQTSGFVVTDQTGGVGRVDLLAVPVNKLAALTASRVPVTDGSGFLSASAVTATTLGFLDATSSIQTQLNAKQGTLTNSAGLLAALSDETGTGLAVFNDTPTLVTPTLGVASATSINKVALTAPATSATLTIADGKTATISNTLTFTGTDASSVAFGTGGTVLYSAGALGTPASGTLTNATGLPPAGIVGWPVNASGVLTNDGAGTLSWGAGGGSQTPWTGAIDGDGFALSDVGDLIPRAGSSLGSAALPWLSTFTGNTTQYESVSQSAGLITHAALGSATHISIALTPKGTAGHINLNLTDTTGLLHFGGLTDSFPAFRYVGAELQLVTGAAASWANLRVSKMTAVINGVAISLSDASGAVGFTSNMLGQVATELGVLNAGGSAYTPLRVAAIKLLGAANLTVDLSIGRNAAGVAEVNNGTAGQWGSLFAGVRDAGLSTAPVGLTLGHQTSGTKASITSGMGISILLRADSTTTADQDAAQITALFTTPTHASIVSDLVFYTRTGGAALAEAGRFTGAKDLNLVGNLQIASTKVVGAQGAAVTDASGGTIIDAEARTALNALLARLRTHGLIAT